MQFQGLTSAKGRPPNRATANVIEARDTAEGRIAAQLQVSGCIRGKLCNVLPLDAPVRMGVADLDGRERGGFGTMLALVLHERGCSGHWERCSVR